jgi:hypothetical protein
MSKRKSQKLWVYSPSPPKFTAVQKSKLLSKTQEMIAAESKLSEKVSRVGMRTNRIYLYEWVEQIKTEGVTYTKPLIDDKYLEFPYARITLNDIEGESCTVDFQRHNDEWMPLYTGTLLECITSIENDDIWF